MHDRQKKLIRNTPESIFPSSLEVQAKRFQTLRSNAARTELKHLLIGSVAKRVIRLAHCPVYVRKKKV